jgi:hypothetical protein
MGYRDIEKETRERNIRKEKGRAKLGYSATRHGGTIFEDLLP